MTSPPGTPTIVPNRGTNMIFKANTALLAGALILAPAAFAAPSPARAQVESPAPAKLAKYRILMTLNGTAPNVRAILDGAKPAIIGYLEQRKGAPLTDADKARLDAIAARVFPDAAEATVNRIAEIQSAGLSETEIDELTRIASTPAAKRFYTAKYAEQDTVAQASQDDMMGALMTLAHAVNEPKVAVPPLEPADGRTQKVLDLLKLEGSEAYESYITRHDEMDAIMAEIGKQVDLKTLTDDQRTRIERVKDEESVRMTQKSLRRSADLIGKALSDADIAGLTGDFAKPVSQKLVQVKFDGIQHKDEIEAALRAALEKVTAAYEAGT